MPISDFIIPLFSELTIHYNSNWAVLHNHQGLPYVVRGDLDIVVGDTNYAKLKGVLRLVAQKTHFSLCQVLWYDVDRCTTFIFSGQNGEVINVDFLLDKYGYSRYGFKSKVLAKKSRRFKGMRILDEEIMFEYRIVKSLSKARYERLSEELEEYQKFIERKITKSYNSNEARRLYEVNVRKFEKLVKYNNRKYYSLQYYGLQSLRFLERAINPSGLVIIYSPKTNIDCVGLRNDFLFNQSFRREVNSDKLNYRLFTCLLFSGVLTLPSVLMPKDWIIMYSGWLRFTIVRSNNLDSLKREMRAYLINRCRTKL